MKNDLLQKWLAYYDPIHRGWTPQGIANGISATNGWFFPRIRGGYNLRRRLGAAPRQEDEIVGAAGAGNHSIQTFPWVRHRASQDYVYRISSVGGGGVENLQAEIIAPVWIDHAGNWPGRRSNAPSDLRVSSLSGGQFLLDWVYLGKHEQTKPQEFRVYHDHGSGTVDYATPVATVVYQRGRIHYSYISQSFSHDVTIRWSVRTVSGDGFEECNGTIVEGRSVNALPPGHPSIFVETEIQE